MLPTVGRGGPRSASFSPPIRAEPETSPRMAVRRREATQMEFSSGSLCVSMYIRPFTAPETLSSVGGERAAVGDLLLCLQAIRCRRCRTPYIDAARAPVRRGCRLGWLAPVCRRLAIQARCLCCDFWKSVPEIMSFAHSASPRRCGAVLRPTAWTSHCAGMVAGKFTRESLGGLACSAARRIH